MRQENLTMFNDTMTVLRQGYYRVNGNTVKLKLSRPEMERIHVYLPDDIHQIASADHAHARLSGRPEISCLNADSFTLARRYARSCGMPASGTSESVLVLNLANPVNPGGGVRKGSQAQEEDLCRKSSLLLSLESKDAQAYYSYNKSLNTYMGSDAIMITPQVEIIKDERGEPLPESVIVSVMTCAAPMIIYGTEDMSDAQYRAMLYNRIQGMLKLSARLGYRTLVLGAFGCGAFHNDAAIVSDLFSQAMKAFDLGGMKLGDCFDRIGFAVLDRSPSQYNYREFSRNFNNFYPDKVAASATAGKATAETYLDRIKGSLLGGAVGDALGYSVEFSSEEQIFSLYGKDGITEYALTNGKALISDDTQMTLFTANGILVADTERQMQGTDTSLTACVAEAYYDWLKTQNMKYGTVNKYPRLTKKGGRSWLLDVPELFSCRAPGGTCLSGLAARESAGPIRDYIASPINRSKGCGGIMRIAPLALSHRREEGYPGGSDALDKEAAQIAAITHSHSLGYMPAAVVSHIISRCISSAGEMSLKEMVLEAKEAALRLFAGDAHLAELTDIMDKAVLLSENTAPDLENIHQLGEGWVAEETLGIALYCALKYQNDFSGAVIAAVNHRGDSDSTGAVTGNILGALLGFSAIGEKWKKELELYDVILETAEDLYRDYMRHEQGLPSDPAWIEKYMNMHRCQASVSKPSCTFFWKVGEENGEFSNWYQRPFVIDDFEYSFVEQYMMAQKAKLFHDSKRYTAILRADDPGACKQLGKQVTPFDPAVWDAAKYEIVKAGNRAKYEQNPDLKAKLLSTGNSILAEASPLDSIWGIALDAGRAAQTDPKNWPGENLLGRVLTELRAEFSNATSGTAPTRASIRMIKADITQLSDVDAIVNAANTSLLGGGGVDGAIHRAAGPGLYAECKKLHGCTTGEAKITGAYDLPCRYVIHTVGPIWNGGNRHEAEKLADCYRNSLRLAVSNGIRSLAFPSISTGAYSFPLQQAARIAVKTVHEFLKANPDAFDLVEWALFDENTLRIYKEALEQYQAE